ncbi:MAG: hypothetical protein AAB631_03250 [Patescibacteria group bacterium]
MQQPVTPVSAPQPEDSKKKMMLWIVLVVLVAIIAAVWITSMNKVSAPSTGQNSPSAFPAENLTPLDEDVQGINMNPIAPDFQSVNSDVNSL